MRKDICLKPEDPIDLIAKRILGVHNYIYNVKTYQHVKLFSYYTKYIYNFIVILKLI